MAACESQYSCLISFRASNSVTCAICAVVMGLYIIYDTQLIVGTRAESFTIDDYIFAAMCLYVDIVRLFLYVLAALGSSDD